MSTVVKGIAMAVCSGVLCRSHYVVSPVINLSLLISNKSDLWWASRMLEICSLQHHTCREDSRICIFFPVFLHPLTCLEDTVEPRTHKICMFCTHLFWAEVYHSRSVCYSIIWPWQDAGLKARLILLFSKHFPPTTFGYCLLQIHN